MGCNSSYVWASPFWSAWVERARSGRTLRWDCQMVIVLGLLSESLNKSPECIRVTKACFVTSEATTERTVQFVERVLMPMIGIPRICLILVSMRAAGRTYDNLAMVQFDIVPKSGKIRVSADLVF